MENVVGKVYKSNSCGEYRVIEPTKPGVYSKFNIEFVKTGYKTTVSYQCIRSGNVKDRRLQTVCGIGCLGDGAHLLDRRLYKKFVTLWYSMLQRCYDVNSPSYTNHGAKGVTVCTSWLNFTNFYKDIPKVSGYNEVQVLGGALVLDKDTKQQNKPVNQRVYSRATCTFITRGANTHMNTHKDDKSYVNFPIRLDKELHAVLKETSYRTDTSIHKLIVDTLKSVYLINEENDTK